MLFRRGFELIIAAGRVVAYGHKKEVGIQSVTAKMKVHLFQVNERTHTNSRENQTIHIARRMNLNHLPKRESQKQAGRSAIEEAVSNLNE
jgi:hypothetical protein